MKLPEAVIDEIVEYLKDLDVVGKLEVYANPIDGHIDIKSVNNRRIRIPKKK